ncbi:MAG TPA: hypothetical protein VFG94_09230 [Acidimicrobiales bacterium]|nr:hypothetical protein [Acidimicrobiales bacterium]
MVALVLSLLIAFGGFGAMVLYAKRRPVGAPLSWGEAMLAATLAFALMFWAYGVVPHQWLTYSGNELSWRPDKILLGPKLPFTGREGLFEYFLPFTVNYENLSHIGAVLIYGLFLGMHVAAWSIWQGRGKEKPLELDSAYGRPLVKQG